MPAPREQLYRQLPQVDEILRGAAGQTLLSRHPRPAVLAAVRGALGGLRQEIAEGRAGELSPAGALDRVHARALLLLESRARSALRPVINAAGVDVVEDQGTGCMIEPGNYGLVPVSSFAASARSAVSLVCASGDKLLGGPQCGIVAGKPALIEKMRVNPLYRAFRAGKLAYAALEATLLAYLSGQSEEIPSIRMLALSTESIHARCRQWAAALAGSALGAEIAPTESMVGGGTSPNATLPSFAVALALPGTGASELAERLRCLDPPVIARINEDRVLLDLRTIPEAEDTRVLRLLLDAFPAAESSIKRRSPAPENDKSNDRG